MKDEEGASTERRQLEDLASTTLSVPYPAPSGAAQPEGRLSRRGLLLLGASLILLAFSLRLIFSSLSVLLPEITQATGLSPSAVAYLSMLPVLAMGIFAPLAPICARRFGIERTLLGALILLAIGTALRGYIGAFGLFIGSVLAGASIAVANVLLPAVVKRDFPLHIATMTALYSGALNVGSSVAAAVTLPVVHALRNSWSAGVAIWALPPVVAAAVWLPQLGRHAGSGTGSRRKVRGLWTSGLAWQVTLFIGLQSAMAYCIFNWLPPILRSRGLSGTQAGLITSVSILMNFVGTLTVPLVVPRAKNQRVLNIIFTVLTGGPLLALLFAPLWSIWFWAVVQGIGQGGMFAIALTVIVLRSPDALVAAELSSMAQTVGYIVASTGPLFVGLLLDWTGGFRASGWLFLALAIGAGFCGWGAGRNLYVKTRSSLAEERS